MPLYLQIDLLFIKTPLFRPIKIDHVYFNDFNVLFKTVLHSKIDFLKL